jgi:hypothetical protein
MLATQRSEERARASNPDTPVEELSGLGYEGGYDAVRPHSASGRGAATAEAYVSLSFAPGEAYQFDWSHEIVC